MASKKTLNATNLEALGATRLAELLLEISTGDAALKRRLRLELAEAAGPKEVAAEVRKRLATIAKSRSLVDWDRQSAFVADLDTQRDAIVSKVAKGDPREALALIWRFMELAENAFERCDDSNGRLGDVFREACDDIGPIAVAAKPDPAELADQVFEALSANDYGQFDALIEGVAPALGEAGLEHLKARLVAWSEAPLPKPRPEDRRVIGWGSNGPIHADDMAERHRDSVVRMGLSQIADAQGDVDAFIAQHSEKARTVPRVTAEIARRLLDAGRAEEALAAVDRAEVKGAGYVPEEWRETRLAALEAAGRSDEAQAFRWECFERALSPAYLRDYLKRLPDFEDMEVEERALAQVRTSPDLHGALSFLVEWPAHALAAELALERAAELDGYAYWVLGPAAEALEHEHPLAATLMLRAMIDFTLSESRTKRYRHAARHLQTCERLATRIEHFGTAEPHATFAARIKSAHGRKSSFWANLR